MSFSYVEFKLVNVSENTENLVKKQQRIVIARSSHPNLNLFNEQVVTKIKYSNFKVSQTVAYITFTFKR